MNDITTTFAITKSAQNYSRPFKNVNNDYNCGYEGTNETLNRNATITKHIWSVPVDASTQEMALDETVASCSALNNSQPSNVTTLERISDLDLVESKLNSLKSQLETSV